MKERKNIFRGQHFNDDIGIVTRPPNYLMNKLYVAKELLELKNP
jgi:hypothetical protein